MKRLNEQLLQLIWLCQKNGSTSTALLMKKKNLRLIENNLSAAKGCSFDVKSVPGGILVQQTDLAMELEADWKVVTKRQPTAEEISAMSFGWRVVKHVKSNAIIYADKDGAVGVGAGQMSRVDSALIAAKKAERMAEALSLPQPLTIGSAVASDAFFPFADGLLEAAAAGATSVIQPGGSMRDDEVIAAADEAGLAMVFTGMRHFRH